MSTNTIENKKYESKPYAKFIEDICDRLIKYFNGSKNDYEKYEKYKIDKVDNLTSHYVECQCSEKRNNIYIFARKIKYLVHEKTSLIHFQAKKNETFGIYGNQKCWTVYYLKDMYEILSGKWILVDQYQNHIRSELTFKFKECQSSSYFAFKHNKKSKVFVKEFFNFYENGKLISDHVKKNNIMADCKNYELVTDLMNYKPEKHKICIDIQQYLFTIDKNFVKKCYVKNIQNDFNHILKCYHLFLERQIAKKQKIKVLYDTDCMCDEERHYLKKFINFKNQIYKLNLDGFSYQDAQKKINDLFYDLYDDITMDQNGDIFYNYEDDNINEKNNDSDNSDYIDGEYIEN